jgi:hypothetical protein
MTWDWSIVFSGSFGFLHVHFRQFCICEVLFLFCALTIFSYHWLYEIDNRYSLVWFYDAEHHFQEYFSYIVVVSFIDHFNNLMKSILHIQHIQTISYWTHALYPYWGRRGRNRIVVGFATTYAVIAYHHWCREFESHTYKTSWLQCFVLW